jgi:6-phosphofructokinase
VIEVFGRYAGFTALLPTMAGAADRCLIPEYAADYEHLTELMTHDHNRNPSRYSVALVSEGASLKSHEGMSFESEETDMFGHRKLGGIGDKVASALKEFSPKYNNGRRIDVVSQRLGYLVRSGDPDGVEGLDLAGLDVHGLDGAARIIVRLGDGTHAAILAIDGLLYPPTKTGTRNILLPNTLWRRCVG